MVVLDPTPLARLVRVRVRVRITVRVRVKVRIGSTRPTAADSPGGRRGAFRVTNARHHTTAQP